MGRPRRARRPLLSGSMRRRPGSRLRLRPASDVRTRSLLTEHTRTGAQWRLEALSKGGICCEPQRARIDKDGEGCDQMPQLRDAAARLAALSCCRLTPGLTDTEFDRVEATYGFTFADDHRAFLAAALPAADDGRRGWPDWRGGGPPPPRSKLGWAGGRGPFDGAHR